MLMVAPVCDEIRTEVGEDHNQAFGIEKLNFKRSSVPAITHVDYSARVQTVDPERNPIFHKLLSSFHEQTDCPVLINTSFNVRGEPIVRSPEDAYRCFRMTNMDVLVLGRTIVLKDSQTDTREDIDVVRLGDVVHDPTQGDRQGNDVGTQYRSAIMTMSDVQKASAENSRDAFQAQLTQAGYGPITTEIVPFDHFWYAEDYHQQYLAKNPGGYCGVGGTGVTCPVGVEKAS